MIAAKCPECGEHLRAIAPGNIQQHGWLACDTCGLSWSEDELDTIDAERETAAADAGEPGVDDPPTVTVPKAEWEALVVTVDGPDSFGDDWAYQVAGAAEALVKAARQ